MQFLNRGIRVLFINEKAEVDIRGAVRNHQDIDIGNPAERAASHAGGVFEVAANQADQRCLRANLNLAKLPQILDNRVQGREGLDRRERQPAQRRAARRRAMDEARPRSHPRRDPD